MSNRLNYTARTNQGLVRTRNEDAYAVIALPDKEALAVIIADGLGGHSRGDVASQYVATYMAEMLPDIVSNSESAEKLQQNLLALLQRANLKLYVEALENVSEYGDMSSTAMVAVMYEKKLVLSHVGDCRCYVLHGRELLLISKDHSVAQEMVKAGILTEDEALAHPDRNRVTQAMGTPAYLEPDQHIIDFANKDRFLFCSDGLYGYVEPEVIKQVMLDKSTPDEVADGLVAAALEVGAPDNVTVITVFA